MRDPYEVLSVNRDASDEDIKKAYRKLAKQYHPDVNPGDKTAEEKMKEINAAYDAIKNGTANQYGAQGGTAGQGGYGGYGYGGYSGYGGYGQSGWQTYTWDPFRGWTAYGSQQQTQQDPEETNELRAARNYIAARHYAEALHVLSNIADRTAKWYYYSAIANAGQGNRILALEHARQACKMDPGNAEYETYLDELERGGNTYRQAGGYSQGMSMGRYCASLCFANLMCNLCCRMGCCF